LGDELPETVKECFKILEENLKILSKIEMDLEDEKEDQITPDMQLHQLYDMADDVSKSSKIRRAEYNLVRRQADNFLD
jgi:hypothetical protein